MWSCVLLAILERWSWVWIAAVGPAISEVPESTAAWSADRAVDAVVDKSLVDLFVPAAPPVSVRARSTSVYVEAVFVDI